MHKKLLLASLVGCTIALTQADDLSMQMLQLNNTSIRSEDNLWQRMVDGFQLNHKETKEVIYWEKRYGNPKYFNIIMQNAAPYLYFVVTEMERRGIPTELALIPIVESTYNPEAVSPAAISTGMWQFLAGSGRRFGMTLNSDIDERKDIVKSTRGAINYLIYLHDMFGSWELAIAAYNWGEGNINNAINSSGSKNFYDLNVRDVTRQYVPKVIALANIIQNPGKFGIKLTDLNNAAYFAMVEPNIPINLNDFVNKSNVTPAAFKKLNPQFKSTSYTAPANQRLLLPVANQPIYAANMQQPSFGVPQLTAPTVIASTTTIQTAISSQPTESDGINQLAALDSDGAANVTIANNISTAPAATTQVAVTLTVGSTNTAATSAQANDILTDSVATTATTTAISTQNQGSSTNFISYTVVPGDTLYSISKKFSVSMDNIKLDNQLVDNNVKLNQKLLIRNPINNS